MAKKIKKRYLFQHHKSVTEGLTFTASTFDSDALLTELLLDSAGPNTSFFVSSRGRIKERGRKGGSLANTLSVIASIDDFDSNRAAVQCYYLCS
jgi:hypothetical protein